MHLLSGFRHFLQKSGRPAPEKPAVEAYNIWADSYDIQPGNLMLDLDEMIFKKLIRNIDLENKQVADIGCGTGRHWQKLYAKKPGLLTGFDVSAGMLSHLKHKFPNAVTYHTTDNLLTMIPDAMFDCIVTTLTIAHISNINEAIASWSRILKTGGDLVITDFHPDTLKKGGKRTFRYKGRILSVINYVHPLEKVRAIFNRHRLYCIHQEERYIDEEVRPYYASQKALHIYEKFKGMPVIYGLHLKKHYAAEECHPFE